MSFYNSSQISSLTVSSSSSGSFLSSTLHVDRLQTEPGSFADLMKPALFNQSFTYGGFSSSSSSANSSASTNSSTVEIGNNQNSLFTTLEVVNLNGANNILNENNSAPTLSTNLINNGLLVSDGPLPSPITQAYNDSQNYFGADISQVRDNINNAENLTGRQKRLIGNYAEKVFNKNEGFLGSDDAKKIDLLVRMSQAETQSGNRNRPNKSDLVEISQDLRQARKDLRADIKERNNFYKANPGEFYSSLDVEVGKNKFGSILADKVSMRLFGENLEQAYNRVSNDPNYVPTGGEASVIRSNSAETNYGFYWSHVTTYQQAEELGLLDNPYINISNLEGYEQSGDSDGNVPV